MPTEDQMKTVLHRYIDAYNHNDLEAVIALYDEHATVEDPYGTPAREGKSQIADFYRSAMANGATLQLVAPVRGSHGNAAAMAFDAVVQLPEGEARVRVIDVMTFSQEGLILSMKAYFGPGDIEMTRAPGSTAG